MNDFPAHHDPDRSRRLLGAVVLAGLNAAKQAARADAGAGVQPARAGLGRWCCGRISIRVGADCSLPSTTTGFPSLGVEYFVGVDGLGLLMVLLTAIVTPMAMLASWRIEDKAPVYYSLMLFLQAGLFGTFTALNFFHWFIFWELSLIPAFFLIKLWGGPQRSAAATQFFIYTMVGSVAMLLSFLAIYLATGNV